MKNSKPLTIDRLLRRLSELYEFNRRLKSFRFVHDGKRQDKSTESRRIECGDSRR
jgi:hypothetical protein